MKTKAVNCIKKCVHYVWWLVLCHTWKRTHLTIHLCTHIFHSGVSSSFNVLQLSVPQWKVHLKPPQTNLWIMMLLFPDFNFIWTITVRLFKIQNSTLWSSCWVYWPTVKTSCSRLCKTNLNFHTQNIQQQNCGDGFFFCLYIAEFT